MKIADMGDQLNSIQLLTRGSAWKVEPQQALSISNGCIFLGLEASGTKHTTLKNSLTSYIKQDYYKIYAHGGGSNRNRSGDTFLSLVATTSIANIKLDITPEEQIMTALCSIFPEPILHVQGSLEVCLSMSPSLPPSYSASFEKYFNLQEILMKVQKKEILSKVESSYPIPSSSLRPPGTKSIQVKLDVFIEWKDVQTVPIPQSLTPIIICKDGQIQVGLDVIMKNLYGNDSNKDFSIVAGNGAEVKCHSVIIAAHSPAFAAMLSPSTGMKESATRRIEMKDISEEGLNHFVRYLYGMKIPTSELTISCDITLQLFQIAHKFEITNLEGATSQLLEQGNEQWFTPDIILELYYFVKNLEKLKTLEDHALRLMTRMTKALRSCERYKELNADEREVLHWKLIELKK